jgi:hypothetical protein
MKKEDLRIGNFYMSVKFGIPVECTLADLYELCVKSDGAYGDPPIEEMFEPIPITKDWLWGLGFDEDHLSPNIFYYPYLASFLTVAIGPHKHVGIVKEKADPVLYMRFMDIEYVHELQNLYFALTGEELIRKEK